MTNYYNYRISPGAAYESFNDLERFHIFVEQNGFAYERIFDDGVNEITVLFCEVN